MRKGNNNRGKIELKRLNKYIVSYLIIYITPFLAFGIFSYTSLLASVDSAGKAQLDERFQSFYSAVVNEFESVRRVTLQIPQNSDLLPIYVSLSKPTIQSELKKYVAQSGLIATIAVIYDRYPDDVFTDRGIISMPVAQNSFLRGIEQEPGAEKTGNLSFLTVAGDGREQTVYAVNRVSALDGYSRSIYVQIRNDRVKQLAASMLAGSQYSIRLDEGENIIFSSQSYGFRADAAGVETYGRSLINGVFNITVNITSADQYSQKVILNLWSFFVFVMFSILGLLMAIYFSTRNYRPLLALQNALDKQYDENKRLREKFESMIRNDDREGFGALIGKLAGEPGPKTDGAAQVFMSVMTGMIVSLILEYRMAPLQQKAEQLYVCQNHGEYLERFDKLGLSLMRAIKEKDDITENGLKQDILEFIHDNISSHAFCKANVVAAVGMSEKVFSRFFKLSFGKTFSDFVVDYRIEKAKELLLNTNDSIQSVMKAVGYNDLSNFTRTFRLIVGATPSKFRNAGAGVPGSDE